jgi:hypothetical protein
MTGRNAESGEVARDDDRAGEIGALGAGCDAAGTAPEQARLPIAPQTASDAAPERGARTDGLPRPGEPAAPDEALQLLRAELRLLAARLRDFTPTRWAASAEPSPMSPEAASAPGVVSRADVARELARTLARLGRSAGSGAPEAEPSALANHGLADQIAVLGLDLLAAPDAASEAPRALRAVLLARSALDGSAIPTRAARVAALPEGR